MAGANPLIPVQNTLHSLQSAPYMHCLVQQHQHMHQHTPQHAFAPMLHQSSTIPPILPTIMEAQDSKSYFHLPQGTTRLSFTPVTAFHRATQKPFRTKRGRWGALHVCIAWKIYYHKQLEKMKQKPNSHHREPTPEYPSAVSLPDSVQHQQSEQPSCMHPNQDSPCGRPAQKNTGERSETGKTSDLSPSSPASCHSHMTKREKLEQPPNLHWRERLDEEEKHRDHHTDTTQGSPLRDKSRDGAVTPEHDGRHGGSLDRKRQLECDSFIKVKRVKQEIVDDQFDPSKTLHTDPSPFSTTHTRPSSSTVPVPHINIGNLSVLYPNSSRCNVNGAPGGLMSYPEAEMYPYPTASWEPTWVIHKRKDLHSRQNDYSLHTCKGLRIPLVGQRQKEAFPDFFMPPLYHPLSSRKQETAYLRGREFLHSCHENCHLHHCRQQLPHPGFLATSYLGQ
ncbi:uncharacterized protein LOC111652156 isoform X1 [Seriola lalandi dorsalis]|uniref:uncharacterized protein LOC111652156 isoform X1 n=1 Tax=Seriola lalandi dorsalis TaxID=1841481 RepID=UPI000C6F75C6|nr:uncharacterized protein LOC111652156 isoform X1 [Seriola lalandi dorsalis]